MTSLTNNTRAGEFSSRFGIYGRNGDGNTSGCFALRHCLGAIMVSLGIFSGSLSLHAEAPPLLVKAISQWAEGREDLAFTQHSRFLNDDGSVKEQRLERYDPSLPDRQRWQLLEVDGQPATPAQREKWETVKNGKPRKKALKPPAEYLDLDHATLLDETPISARFDVGLRPEAARLLAVEKIAVVITVEKKSGRIAHVEANLRQPMKVLMGLARITDLDIDVHIDPKTQKISEHAGDVQSGSTARVSMSKLGSPVEYSWSDFKRVASYRGASKTEQ